MLLQVIIGNLYRSSHNIRFFQSGFRNQQYVLLWSESLLRLSYSCAHAPIRSQVLARSQELMGSHYSRARIKPHTSYLCHNALLAREADHCMYQYSQCYFHLSSSLDNQNRISAKPTKEEIFVDKDEERISKKVIVDGKSLKDSFTHYEPRQQTYASSTDESPSVATKSKTESNDASIRIEKAQELWEESPAHSKSKKKEGNSSDDCELQSRVQRYFLWQYSRYLKKFQESLKQEMPDTFNMFHIFTVGVKEFVIDFKDFIKVLVVLSLPGCSLHSLSHHQLLLYHHMPGDMFRVLPVLLLSSIPFGQNFAFPIGYWFPRHLLCRHFWDIQQRHQFSVINLKQRLYNARPVFRSLQAALTTITDNEQQEKCREVFNKLGSGIHPSTEEIISLIPLFEADPFHIKSIWVNHMNGLLRLHGRSVWGRRRQRLEDHARMLHCMDSALDSDTLAALPLDTLKTCLFLRGLNPSNMSTTTMMEFMESWLKVSRALDPANYSLLLHLPILLAYNQPSNVLIY